MHGLTLFKEYFPLLFPILLIQLGLQITALIHIFKHPTYRFGNRIIWVAIVVFGQMLGAILYFIVGRGESE